MTQEILVVADGDGPVLYHKPCLHTPTKGYIDIMWDSDYDLTGMICTSCLKRFALIEKRE